MADQEGFGVGGLGGQPEIARLVGEFIARWSLAKSALLMSLLVAMDFSRPRKRGGAPCKHKQHERQDRNS